MQNIPIYEALAQAFAAEGVDTHFTLMGDGNMHWVAAMQKLDGMSTFSARHEHCACAMAMGYHCATGKVGVASVTCGPGFTQIMTALTTASRGRIPLVVFAGEAPIHAKWYNQALDQPPFAAACDAHYISAHSPQRMYQYVREAFYVARHDASRSCSACLTICRSSRYLISARISPHPTCCRASNRMPPHPHQVDELVDKLLRAKCPIILAGRGVVESGAAAEVEEWPSGRGRCWRRRCWRAACSTTIRSRSALPAASPGTSRAKWARSRSRDRVRHQSQLLHRRWRQHVPQGRGGADRHRAAWTGSWHEIRRPASRRRREIGRGRDCWRNCAPAENGGGHSFAGTGATDQGRARRRRRIPDRRRHARPRRSSRNSTASSRRISTS